MEIAPNSIIRLFSGVPLDSSYKNTIYFESLAEQEAYFTWNQPEGSQITMLEQFTHQYYTRVNKGVIRVHKCADDLYTCNYMTFRNTAYGNKWFYAFVTSVEWLNNEVAELTFQIDVMQTYMFDATLRQSFVIREHSVTDNIGDNIVPEPLEIGEIVPNKHTPEVYYAYDKSAYLDILCTIVATIDEDKLLGPADIGMDLPWFDAIAGRTFEGIYSGLTLRAFRGSSNINAFLTKYKENPRNVVYIYTCPVVLIDPYFSHDSEMTSAEGYLIPASNELNNPVIWETNNIINDQTTIDGYLPRNKKLLTSPFNSYLLFNSSGNSLTLKYEDFRDLHPTFQIDGNVTYPPSAECYPRNYKGLQRYTIEKLVESDYPPCSWYSDYYQEWLANVGYPETMKGLQRAVVGTFFGTAQQFMSGNKNNWLSEYAQGFAGEANTLNDFYIDREVARNHSNIFRGSVASGSLAIASSQKNFFGIRTSIKAEAAVRFDEFFDRYGYATSRLKIPNRHVRPYYTYTQTKGCNIVGKMPTDDINLMQTIYDNGITFWDKDAVVGDYSVDNRPV